MPFRVSARTVLQLGAELISSDAVAFYELVKNALDAGSKNVRIDVVVRLDTDVLETIRSRVDEQIQRLESSNEKAVSLLDFAEELLAVQAEIIRGIIPASLQVKNSFQPVLDELQSKVEKCRTWIELRDILDEVNYIEFSDNGSGMSLDDLQNIYLTIGTPHRLYERVALIEKGVSPSRRNSTEKIPLGEKGVGRLSAMRLGEVLYVRTTKTGETYYNELKIDWNHFAQLSDKFIEDVPVEPSLGAIKEEAKLSGTRLRIYRLQSEWTKDKLEIIAKEEFSRLVDPFLPEDTPYPIRLYFNYSAVIVPPLEKFLFEAAHASVLAEYRLDNGNPLLTGKINYILRSREKVFRLDAVDLRSISGLSSHSNTNEVLRSLGPFSVQFYWYNRRILTALDGIGERAQVKELVKRWGGGLMLFRDGFRVNPYGSKDDDWLGLDPLAFGSSGYKVNRSQIIGKVDISSIDNPFLSDQTNREGLRNTPEKNALVGMLQHLLVKTFKGFLNSVDEEVQAREPVQMVDVEKRVAFHELRAKDNLRSLQQTVGHIPQAKEVIKQIEHELEQLSTIVTQVQNLAKSYDAGRSQLVHLAGIGLMVEIITHELNRATEKTLNSFAATSNSPNAVNTNSVLKTLEAQLRTLQKRLRVLDPLDTNARQAKINFDLIEWIREILDAHSDQFTRHSIKCVLRIEPANHGQVYQVNGVKGMYVQIFENLINNSVYWLGQERLVDSSFEPTISVVIYPHKKEIHFTDNGPGVPKERKDEIFEAFVSTKPPSDGKGLGLFVSKEIANYHKSTLSLLENSTVHDDRLNTFVLTVPR